MAAHYVADTGALGLGRPDAEPLASESIDAIVDLIGALIERGHAYAADGDVYFRVRSDADYGSLSHRAIDDMNQGEDSEGTARKEDPLDFALWKAQKQGEDSAWDAPWGRGRPGWHIECSAMAEALLGVGFEIHGGGNDLAFPHHENEAAQTRMGRGAELAQIWMHNGMLQLEGMTMGKSLGNAIRLHEVIGEVGRDALVMLFAGAHYRQPMMFDDERLAEAGARVERVRDAARRLADGASPADMRPQRDAFFAALAEDFNTAQALGALFEWIREANRRSEPVGRDDLVEMLTVLGLENLAEADDAAGGGELELLTRREAARAAKDWAEADRMRDELAARGWTVRDGPSGPVLVRRSP
jgi:cysteinyl-tRNA synthetase